MMNAFHGIGRIANNLTLSKTPNGKTVLRFTLAIDKRNKKKLEEQNLPGTNFISCVAWESVATTIENYFKKGDGIGINGSIDTRSYDHPKHPDVKVYVTEVLVETIDFLPGRKQEQNQMNTVDDYITEQPLNPVPDDLPF